jgi:glycerol-3-phosphate dehydrogenase (NAD(P)+)
VSAAKLPIGVVGGGPWGVALALAASRAGADVVLHTRRESPHTGDRVRTTADYAEVARARLLLLAVPSTVVREVLRALGDHLDGSHLVVHGVRGFGSDGSASLDEHVHAAPAHGPFETVSDIVRAETPVRRTGALGGPVQASEMIEGRPSAMVCGSHYPEVIAAVTSAMANPALRVYGTHDLRGLEWGAALVGCLSIGVGFAQQAGAGPGLLAALISRGVEEAARIAATDGAEERTLLGLGGYGDLLASIALADRPEVMVGKALARGRTIDEAVAEARLRVEAIGLIPRVARFAREGRVPAPTFDALEEILAGTKPPAIIERMFAG